MRGPSPRGLAVSSYEAKLVEEDFGVRPIVVEHGVEEWLLELEWRPSGYAIYGDRIERYKNVHRLARVVKHLNEIGFELRLKVFGDRGYREELRRHLDRLGLDYELAPPQPYERYAEALSRADLLGLLSEREAFGQVVNEANAIGVPAVVAKPWGLNFRDRSRTLVVDLGKSDEGIAEDVVRLLDKAKRQPKSPVPSWNQVVNLYVKILYGTT